MSREWRLYLNDLLAACAKVQAYAGEMTREEFESDDRTRDAVLRNLEVAGEAAKKIPPEIRNLMPGVPRRNIAGFRDYLAHEYFGLDADIVWNVIREEIPRLRAGIEDFQRRDSA